MTAETNANPPNAKQTIASVPKFSHNVAIGIAMMSHSRTILSHILDIVTLISIHFHQYRGDIVCFPPRNVQFGKIAKAFLHSSFVRTDDIGDRCI